MRLGCMRGRGAREQEIAFAGVAGESSRALELRTRYIEAAELGEQIGADCGQQVVGLQRRVVEQSVDDLEAGGGSERHAGRDTAIQLDLRRRRELGERVVEGDDAWPVGVFGRARAGMTGGDGCLERVWAERAGERLGTREGGEAAADEELIPARAILIE